MTGYLEYPNRGQKVRYFTASGFVETLYRGLADSPVGRVIGIVLLANLIVFAPLGDTEPQLPLPMAKLRVAVRRPM
jgi:hypothetical protein